MARKSIKQHAKEQEAQVKSVLGNLFLALMELDSVRKDGTNTSYYIDYDTQDMFHAASIMYSVCSNYAIKHGIINAENATEKITRLREAIKETFGLDTIEEAKAQSIINNTKGGDA